MPATPPAISKANAAQLSAIGARLKAHRKTLGVSATTAAEAAGMSRMTLHRIERGEASVTIGAYVSAIAALGLRLELGGAPERTKTEKAEKLPRHIRIGDYPQLRRLAWQLGEGTTLTPKEALALYERNWRHVDKATIHDAELALIRLLSGVLGGDPLV